MFVLLIGTGVDFLDRENLHIAIVAMTGANSHNTTDYDVCPPQTSDLHRLVKPKPSRQTAPVYDWDQPTQGIILAAFFWSYAFVQIPGGRLAEVFGGKYVMLIGLLGSAVINLLTPLFAKSTVVLIISRVVMGFLNGGIFPAAYTIVANWLPLKERSTGIGLVGVSMAVGSILSGSLTGYLSHHGFAGGWPSAFYVAGKNAKTC